MTGGWEYETFTTLEEAWAYEGPIPLTTCKGKVDWDAERPDNERKAAELADIEDGSSAILDVYGLCGAKDGFYTMEIRPMEEPEYVERSVREMTAMLALCPDFPHAGKVQENLNEAVRAIGERESGKRFGDGTYIVGQEIQPGTWLVERSPEGCYWELLDSAGNILDNNFVMGSTRVVVKISAGHYSFHTSGCGEWVRQD